jgi:hypothetical protein
MEPLVINTSNNINYNSPNFPPASVKNTLQEDQQPLGTQFRSYELNRAVNYYLLDPFQYSITKFDYNLPNGEPTNKRGDDSISSKDFKNDPGLIYRNVDFDTLLPTFTGVKKSANDLTAMDYHRFLANNGYFNPNEGTNNTDLWYYGADQIRQSNDNVGGAPLNVQEVNHIIFPEPTRGGTNTQLLAKYSWTSKLPQRDTTSWESINYTPVDNSQNCEFFNYNRGYTTSSDSFKNQFNNSFDKVYSFDSNYLRGIGITPPNEGSMPYAPNTSSG